MRDTPLKLRLGVCIPPIRRDGSPEASCGVDSFRSGARWLTEYQSALTIGPGADALPYQPHARVFCLFILVCSYLFILIYLLIYFYLLIVHYSVLFIIHNLLFIYYIFFS